MAWECSASSHRCLVQNLVANHLLTSDIVIRAFQRVDRSWFVPSSNIHEAFEDRPLPIGHNVTISAPHMHAIMAEIMAPFVVGEKRRVLDIGSGSGFLTCVLAAMANESSSVVGVEHVPQLLDSSKASVAAHFSEWMTQHDDSSPPRIVFVEGDGLQLSSKNLPYPQFDAIHVGAAPSQVPQCLVDLLAPNGVLVVPVGPRSCTQQLLIVSKDAAGGVTTKVHSHVVFVPLTSLQHQLHPS